MGGRWCRKKFKDVAYFAQEPCFTTDEEYHLQFAQEIMKAESNTNKLNQDTNKMEQNANTKVCKICGKELPIDQFRPNPKCKDGHLDTCYECLNKKIKAGIVKSEKESATEKTKDPTKPYYEPTMDVDPFNPFKVFSDYDLVAELRERGWSVTCTKVIEL